MGFRVPSVLKATTGRDDKDRGCALLRRFLRRTDYELDSILHIYKTFDSNIK
jgi:hypothetical protein